VRTVISDATARIAIRWSALILPAFDCGPGVSYAGTVRSVSLMASRCSKNSCGLALLLIPLLLRSAFSSAVFTPVS